MADKIKAVRRVFDLFCLFSAWAGMWLTLIMAFLILADIFLRKYGLGPRGVFEMGSAMLCITVFFVIPYTWMVGRHIRVSLFLAMFKPRMQGAIDAFAAIVCGCLFALLAWRNAIETVYMYRIGDITAEARIPIWIIFGSIAIGSCLLSIRGFISAGEIIQRILKPKDEL